VRAGVRYLSRDPAAPPPYAANGCPTAVQNIVQTGSPIDDSDANKHFPWKGVPSAQIQFQCPSIAFSGANYNDAGHVVTLSATVPVTMSLIYVVNRFLRLSDASQIAGSYPLTVTYQARYIGN
jgi:hypothetical protein